MQQNNQLLGLHHVTAMTSSAEKNYQFFTKILGIRLVKKTVNQDDIFTYHTFFADDVASPGIDITFFDFPNMAKGQKGTNRISKTSFRVPSDLSLSYWQKRFEEYAIENEGIQELFEKKILPFTDFDGQDYQLVSDEKNRGVPAGTPWQNGPVLKEHAIVGLGPVEISISYVDVLDQWLVEVLHFEKIATSGKRHLYQVGLGGNGAQILLKEDMQQRQSMQGYGEVHHVALRVSDHKVLEYWINKMKSLSLPNSGYVDRFYFKSLYVRVGHILFEFATDGPGFMQDEDYEHLGEKLSLPPFLEKDREKIEKQIRPFETVWRG